MQKIEMTIQDDLLESVDHLTAERGTTRSEFLQAAIPGEFDFSEAEQAWDEK